VGEVASSTVERTGTENASTRIRLGVSELSALVTWACAEIDHTGVRNSSPSRNPGPEVSLG
jgi:hypothetical protein